MHDDDPGLAATARARRPPVRMHRWAYLRLQHRAALDELAVVDAEFVVLAARRRSLVRRIERLGDTLWPRNDARHVRRRYLVDVDPHPPAPAGAVALSGEDLRATALAILRRHGPLRLRELDGLLHRYGYVVAGPRPVQRLADAMAYEVRASRCRRVSRGVYEAVPADDPSVALAGDPLAWGLPGEDEAAGPHVDPAVDPSIRSSDERWSGGAWPPDARARQAVPAPTTDGDLGHVRDRLGRLIEDRLRRSDPPPGTDDPAVARWHRIVNESPLMVRDELQWEQPTWRSRRGDGDSGGSDRASEPDPGPI